MRTLCGRTGWVAGYAPGVPLDVSHLILKLDGVGGSLSVSARRRQFTPPGDEPWFDCQIEVDAPPLVSGTLSSIFTRTELQNWAQTLDGFGHPPEAASEGPRRAVLGGGRAAVVAIEVEAEEQRDDQDPYLTVCVEATPSGDDPYPFVRYLIFGLAPFWSHAVRRISDVSEG